MAIENQNLGMRTDRLLTIRVPLSPQRYADAAHRITFFKELLRCVESLPGVESAAMSIGMHPLAGWKRPWTFLARLKWILGQSLFMQ